MRCVLVVALLVLAGCAEPRSEEDRRLQELIDGTDVSVDVTADTGAIRGIVVDPAINPVAGATASIADREARTDPAGTFGFDGLEPGVYFVHVTMRGFVAVEQAVTVVAGRDPGWTRFVLERAPPEQPRFDAYTHEGFENVGIGFCAAGFCERLINWGGGDVVGNYSSADYGVGEAYEAIQSELVYDPTIPTNRLSLGHSAWPPNGYTGCGIALASAPSPIVLRTYLDDTWNCFSPIEPPMVLKVSAYGGWDPDQDPSVGIAVLQEFVVYTHIFYNFIPPEDWMFVHDGPPV